MSADAPIDRLPGASRVGVLRVESSLGVAVSAFGLAVALQALPAVAEQWPHLHRASAVLLVVLVYGSVVLAALAAFLRRWMRTAFAVAAGAYLLVLALWTGAVLGRHAFLAGDTPWPFALLNLAEAYLLIVRRDWVVPAMYALLTCFLVGFLRTTPYGGSTPPLRATFDGISVLLVDAALVVLTVAVRQAARGVDAAQGRALQRYARAQSDQAVEVERVQVDALVHDKVLTTFLAAAHARDAAGEALAARMAVDTIGQLAAADMAAAPLPHVPLSDIANRIQTDTGGLAALFTLRATEPTDRVVPGRVAEAVVAAVVQAMVNSANHAGDAHVLRWVRLAVDEDGRLEAVVGDRGAGFDVNRVGAERLGVRVSITERMLTVGGVAQIESSPARGTRVKLLWPDPAGGTTPRVAARMPQAVGS